MAECVSCGGEANPKSPRDFCTGCDEHFKDGERHQKEVLERHERLEVAKESGDTEQFSAIMRDIYDEAAAMSVAADPGYDATEQFKVALKTKRSKGGK